MSACGALVEQRGHCCLCFAKGAFEIGECLFAFLPFASKKPKTTETPKNEKNKKTGCNPLGL